MRLLAPLTFLALLATGPLPTISAPQTLHGLTCRVTGVHMVSTLQTDAQPPRRNEVQVVLGLSSKGAFALDPARITQALDDRERDIRITPSSSPEPPEYARQRLESALQNAVHREPGSGEHVSATAHLTRCPPSFQRLTGELDAIIPKRLVREKVALATMPEPIEVAPGVTFLFSSVQTQEGSVTFSYEVRIKRNRDGITPGLEPVFAGLVLRGADGRLMQTFGYHQPVELRDEYLYVAKNQGLSTQHLERGAEVEVAVFDGLERVRFEFGLTNLDITAAEGE